MKELADLKVAIVHDVLDRYGGAERVVESFLKIWPQADVFTSRRGQSHEIKFLESRTIKTSFMQYLPLFKTFAKFYTPFYPLAFESFDLSKYDLIISSTAHFAKAVLTNPDQLHICYCHTPPRFLYGYPSESQTRNHPIFKPFVKILDHFLREYDFIVAQRPDFIITNSQNTAARIQKFYRRDAEVIYPPVEVEYFRSESVKTGEYYLVVSRLVAYKNNDTVIQAFNEMNRPLVMVGDGPDKNKLLNLAKDNVQFRGFVPPEELAPLYRNAKALIIASNDEDFGITAVEAMASGTPVIALRSGGSRETVVENVTGIFYEKNDIHGLKSAVELLEKNYAQFDSNQIQKLSRKYAEIEFNARIKKFVESKY